MAARRSTLVAGIRIVSSSMAKAMLALVDTTAGALINPVRAKIVTYYPGDLL